jgi:hypothetical protein
MAERRPSATGEALPIFNCRLPIVYAQLGFSIGNRELAIDNGLGR